MMSRLQRVSVQRLHPSAQLPTYGTPGARGADLYALSAGRLYPGRHVRVPTGLALEIPEGWGALVVPRSGLAARHGVGVVNSPGLIDSDYRGELEVLLENRGVLTFEWKAGARIAQLVLVELPQAWFVEVTELSETERGAGGFGSTGN